MQSIMKFKGKTTVSSCLPNFKWSICSDIKQYIFWQSFKEPQKLENSALETYRGHKILTWIIYFRNEVTKDLKGQVQCKNSLKYCEIACILEFLQLELFSILLEV